MAAYCDKLCLSTRSAFLLTEGVWLGFVARKFYGRYLGFLQKPNPNWLAASLSCLLFVAGILLFVIIPALQHESVKRALVCDAIFDLVTYDLTNLAIIKDWALVITVVDLAWGASSGAAVV